MKRLPPAISRRFLKQIRSQKSSIKPIGHVKIKTCKNVFPPQSLFSRSSRKLNSVFGNLRGETVLDIGTGTGIHAIEAKYAGAKKVIATDISPYAVKCAKENILLNGFQDGIKIIKSDLFRLIPKQKFDVIIANLPIADFYNRGIVALTLFDRGFRIHDRFFKNAKKFLKNNGKIIMSHANLYEDRGFDFFEKSFEKYGFKADKITVNKSLGYEWRFYVLKNQTK